MASELDVVTLAISMLLTLYLLATHSSHFWKTVKESAANSSASRRNLHKRKRHSDNSIESSLVLGFIILDIMYFVMKYAAHIGDMDIACSTVTATYLSLMATSVWTVELFFLFRGWRILSIMATHAAMLDLDESVLAIYDAMCRIGIAFVVLCAVVTVVLVFCFVEYEEIDSLCVPTGRYKHQITASAFSMMACAVGTGVMALFAFAKPLTQYQSALNQRSQMVTPPTGDGKESAAVAKNNRRQQTLRHTLIRVVVCLIVVHVMFLVSGVFHVLVNSPEKWGYGSRKIYRSLYCACSVLMIVSMQMTYQDWRIRMFPCNFERCSRTKIHDAEKLEMSMEMTKTTTKMSVSSKK